MKERKRNTFGDRFGIAICVKSNDPRLICTCTHTEAIAMQSCENAHHIMLNNSTGRDSEFDVLGAKGVSEYFSSRQKGVNSQ